MHRFIAAVNTEGLPTVCLPEDTRSIEFDVECRFIIGVGEDGQHTFLAPAERILWIKREAS